MRNNQYRDLIVWQKAMKLVELVYEKLLYFPKEEIYGLASQIKRSVISIPTNITEGKGRKTDKEFIQFLHIALGSLYELQTQIELAKRLNMIENIDEIENRSLEIEKMLNALINSKKEYK
ncbi:four helix bundle protein [Nitrosophilus labii]|uniref:four helix bundle protein n=1 Tax=Nitrosophilus labii TaxID=2706014 RepID=UPI0016569911|nr:four helix bundle protein [Nitrosophilus labii]